MGNILKVAAMAVLVVVSTFAAAAPAPAFNAQIITVPASQVGQVEIARVVALTPKVDLLKVEGGSRVYSVPPAVLPNAIVGEAFAVVRLPDYGPLKMLKIAKWP